MRVTRHHATALPPHGCPHCPLNLCKGGVLDALRAQWPSDATLVYVGDGRGDYCPTLRLGASDWVFARSEYALGELWRARIDASRMQRLSDGRMVHHSAPGAGAEPISLSTCTTGSAQGAAERPNVLFWENGEQLRDTLFELLAKLTPVDAVGT